MRKPPLIYHFDLSALEPNRTNILDLISDIDLQTITTDVKSGFTVILCFLNPAALSEHKIFKKIMKTSKYGITYFLNTYSIVKK